MDTSDNFKRSQALYLMDQGAEAWNAWAMDLLRERDSLIAEGTWIDSEPVSEEVQRWRESAAVDLRNHTFERSVNFSEFIFPGEAHFDHATFQGNARFDRCVFNDHVSFHNAEFGASAGFWKSTFHGRVDFAEALFADVASFAQSRFLKSADFCDVRFFEDSWFSAGDFQRVTSFSKAVFWGKAGFEEATFGADVTFLEARFRGNSGFQKTIFNHNASFQDAAFIGGGSFDNVNFANVDKFAFKDAYLLRISFENSFNLTQTQINFAHGTLSIRLPAELQCPPHWSDEINVPFSLSSTVSAKNAPIAAFEWRQGEYHPNLTLLAPGTSSGGAGSSSAASIDALNSRLKVIARLAQDARAALKLRQNDKRDDGHVAERVSICLADIAKECRKSGGLIHPVYLRRKVRTIEIILQNLEANVLDSAELDQLNEIVYSSYSILKLNPLCTILREFDNPNGTNLVSESVANRIGEYSDRLLALIDDPDVKKIFSEHLIEFIREVCDDDALGRGNIVHTPESRTAHLRRKAILLVRLAEDLYERVKEPPQFIVSAAVYTSLAQFFLNLFKIM